MHVRGTIRIGIDARMLGKGFGLARYIEQLLDGLQRADTTGLQFVLFLRKDNWDAVPDGLAQVEKVLADVAWYSVQEQLTLPGIIKRAQLDLMHFPHWNVPLLYRATFVVTIHDLTMFHYPRPEATTHGPLLYRLKDWVHRIVVKSAARRAEHILVTSGFTGEDVQKTLGVEWEKMRVTYQAPFDESQKSKVKSQKSVLNTYSIQKPFVLYVGAAYPHKNLDGLLAAWREVKAYDEMREYSLVLVGKDTPFYQRVREQSADDPSVQHVGFVPDDNLELLYKAASLFVFPSLYEGFGIPPLEAMQRNLPVVSSNLSCLPEVLADAALYADPTEPQAFADAIYTALTDENVRLALRQNAREVLQRYDWDRLSEETVEVYRGVTLDHNST